MTIADKLRLIANNVQKVFDAGKKSEYDTFWDEYQQNGNRENYYCAFAGVGWTQSNFSPKWRLKPESAYMMFGQGCNAILTSDDLPESIIDFSNCTNMQYVFYTNTVVQSLGTIDLSSANIIMGLFGAASNLRRINRLIFSEKSGNSNTTNMFQNCTALESVGFEGVINCNGIDLHWSTKLNLTSLRTLLTALNKNNTTNKTLTLATVHEAMIEADAEAKAQLISAKNAKWTISYN